MAAFLMQRGAATDCLFLFAALKAPGAGGAGENGIGGAPGWRERAEGILSASLRPELYWWGLLRPEDGRAEFSAPPSGPGGRARASLPAPGAFLAARAMGGAPLTRGQFRVLCGDGLAVFPPRLAALLASPDTYMEGARLLRERHAEGSLLRRDTPGPLRLLPAAFDGSDQEYDDLVALHLRGHAPWETRLVRAARRAVEAYEPSPRDRELHADVLRGFARALEGSPLPYSRGDMAACEAVRACFGEGGKGFRSVYAARRYPARCPLPLTLWAVAAALTLSLAVGLDSSAWTLLPAGTALLWAFDMYVRASRRAISSALDGAVRHAKRWAEENGRRASDPRASAGGPPDSETAG
jgi:hypothetical protein